MKTSSLLAAALLFAAVSTGALAQQNGDAEVDLAALALSLARIQEPELSEREMSRALDEIVAASRKALAGVQDPFERVARLNQVLLGGRQVSYLSNKYWRDSTLAASLLRKQGNCLSTTTLYVVVGAELDLPIHGVLIPKHAFARYADEKVSINIETTAGGAEQPDEHYREMFFYPQVEVETQGYGRSLTRAEFASVLHHYAGRHLFQLERHEEALAQIEEARKLWPDNPGYELERLAVLYDGLGRREEALSGYELLLRSTRSVEVRTSALLALAGDRHARGEQDEALSMLRPAYGIAPKYLQGRILSLMASCYRTQRRFGEAMQCQELATVLEGEAEDYTGLAIYYKNADRLDDAIWALEQALAKNPEDWNTRLILAGYMIRAGREEDGWKMKETVEAPRVDLEFFETNLAWFYGSVGKKAEFLEHLGKALELSESAHILNYIETEVDFDRYREDPDFKALVEKHRKRLLGGGR